MQHHPKTKTMAILTAIPAAVLLVGWLIFAKRLESGTSTAGFIGLVILFPLALLLGGLILTNAVLAGGYIFKHKPKGKHAILPALVVVLPIFIVGIAIQSNRVQQVNRDKYRNSPFVSRDEALRRIKSCQVRSLYEGDPHVTPRLYRMSGAPRYSKTQIHPSDIEAVKKAIEQSKKTCSQDKY